MIAMSDLAAQYVSLATSFDEAVSRGDALVNIYQALMLQDTSTTMNDVFDFAEAYRIPRSLAEADYRLWWLMNALSEQQLAQLREANVSNVWLNLFSQFTAELIVMLDGVLFAQLLKCDTKMLVRLLDSRTAAGVRLLKKHAEVNHGE